jgi:hypothetical protein
MSNEVRHLVRLGFYLQPSHKQAGEQHVFGEHIARAVNV